MGRDRAVESSRKRRLFFYLAVLTVALALSVAALSGCGEQGGTAQSELVSRVVFEANNGEAEIICREGDEMPKPKREGYVFKGWYRDEDLTDREEGETLAEIIEANGRAEEIRLYGKWEEEKEQKGVRMEDAFFIYDGNLHGLEIKGAEEGSEIEYVGESGYRDAGEYEIVAVVKCEGYRETEVRGKLEILRAKIDESGIVFADKTEVWDGEEKRIEIDGELPAGIEGVIYENNGHREAGEYEVRVRFEVGKNYEEIGERVAVLRIIEKKHEVKFIEEDGSYRIIEAVHGKGISEIPEPKSKRGYKGKWTGGDFSKITEDIEVYAEYEAEEYRITYELNGGELAGELKEKYTVEEGVEMPKITRENYEFNGWYENGERIERIEKGSIGEREIRAEWKAVEYCVEYETYGGINDVGNTTDGKRYVYTVESENLKLGEAKRRGYIFKGWKDGNGDTVTEIISAEARNISLYAEWETEVYAIRYELRGGINSAGAVEEYTVESGEIELADAQRRGYVFEGWYEDAECAGERKERIRGEEARDTVLYAKWRAKEYIIEYEMNGGENDIANPEVYTIESGILSLESAQRRGYTFKGWYLESGERTEKIDSALCENIKIKAKWEIIEYAVVYEMNGGENSAGNPTVMTVESEERELQAGRKEGCVFAGWYTNAEYEGGAVTEIDGSECREIVLYAKWEKEEEPEEPEPEKSEYEAEEKNGKWTVTGYDYGRGTSVLIPKEIGGRQVEGIAAGVLVYATEIEIEAEIREIGREIFAGCEGVKRIAIRYKGAELEAGVFKDCKELEELELPNAGLREMKGEDGIYEPLSAAFGEEERCWSYVVTARPMQVVNGEEDVYYDEMPRRYVPQSLRKVVINGRVQGYGLYGLRSIEEIEVRGEEIGVCGLRDCTGLKDLKLRGTKKIAATGMKGCEGLERVYALDGTDVTAVESALSAARLNPIVLLSL